MIKEIKAYKVTDLKKVNKTLYIEGDIFISEKGAGMLVNGDIKPLVDEEYLKLFVRKTALKDYPKTTEVQQMIDDAIGGV